jgi:hypothetical protein
VRVPVATRRAGTFSKGQRVEGKSSLPDGRVFEGDFKENAPVYAKKLTFVAPHPLEGHVYKGTLTCVRVMHAMHALVHLFSHRMSLSLNLAPSTCTQAT